MKFATESTLKNMAASPNAAAVAVKVLELQTSDKFRLAAMLLDLGKQDLAEAVGTRACQEIQLAQLFDDRGYRAR